MSHDPYRKIQNAVASPRDAEYLAFSKITAKLIEAQTYERDEVNRLICVLNDNRLLWGILARDCAEQTNLLPAETRAAIISLDHWVQRHSRDIIRKGEDIQPLIDINRIIMDGLAGRQVDPEAA